MAAEWINVTTLPGFSKVDDFGSFTEGGGEFVADGFINYDPRENYTGAQMTLSATGLPSGKVLTGLTRITVSAAVGFTYDLYVAADGGASSTGAIPLVVLGTCSTGPSFVDFAQAYVAEGIPNFGPTSATFIYEVQVDDAPPPGEFWTDFRGCEEQA